jgi:hypothetical protein
MRIAICFSGQIRTGVESSENIKRFIGDLYPYCDFFIHTWNVNSQKPYNLSRIIKKQEIITTDKVEKILDIYNPKSIIIDDFYEKEIEENNFYNFAPLWYSIKICNNLKINFENENNIKYDYVVKLRFDIIFKEKRRLIDDIFANKNNDFFIENLHNYTIDDLFVDDVYFLSNSNVMDIAANYYNNGHKYGFIKHLTNNNISIKSVVDINYMYDNYGYVIYRQECIKFSPLNDFDLCHECEAYYYQPVDQLYNNKEIRHYIEDLMINYNIDDPFNVKDGIFLFVDELISKKNKLI